MLKKSFVSFLVVTLLILGCSNNSPKKESSKSRNPAIDGLVPEQSDTFYMHTGFYFLSNEQGGIKLKKEGSNEVYILNKVPFASVANIEQTELITTRLKQGDYTELCLKFDEKGKIDLEKGTGNSLHPQIAIVLAGKLLYVVDNLTKATTGVWCIGLIGYSEKEMIEIKSAVDQKL